LTRSTGASAACFTRFRTTGIDLRYRVDYGSKCCRESCPESKTFSDLGEDAGSFWLHLADSLDSFSYSSRNENPLFHILGWGTHLLELIPCAERYGHSAKMIFSISIPFSNPAGSLSPLSIPQRRLIGRDNVHFLKNEAFREEFEQLFFASLFAPETVSGGPSGATFVHRLPLDRDFLDYLRLFARIEKIPGRGPPAERFGG
jgi:hypothetical protein